MRARGVRERRADGIAISAPQDANSDAGSTNMGSSVTGTLGHGNMSSHVKRAKRLR